jgi:hypothetical protein
MSMRTRSRRDASAACCLRAGRRPACWSRPSRGARPSRRARSTEVQLSNYCFRILYFALRNFGMNFGPPGLTDSTGIVGFCRRRWVACSIMTVPHSGFIGHAHGGTCEKRRVPLAAVSTYRAHNGRRRFIATLHYTLTHTQDTHKRSRRHVLHLKEREKETACDDSYMCRRVHITSHAPSLSLL